MKASDTSRVVSARLMVILLPLFVVRRRMQTMAAVAISSLVMWSVILLPLRTWSFVASVPQASAGNAVDVEGAAAQ
jgi:hypothetical protein